MSGPAGLEALRRAADAGEARTVRVCFSDHYGVLRGRRIAAPVFAADPDARQGFCDGALVWDIRCDIFEGIDFSNYGTGYPDLYVRPEHGTLRPCAWTAGEWSVFGDCRDDEGEAIDVDPRGILRAIAARSGSPNVTAELELHLEAEQPDRFIAAIDAAANGIGIELVALVHSAGDGVARIGFPGLGAIAAADALVTLRSAAREIAATSGVAMTAMSQTEEGGRATRLLIEVTDESGRAVEQPAVEELALLLRPLPSGAHGVAAGGSAVAVAASDANPYLAIAAAIAAAAEPAAEPRPAVESGTGDPYRSSIRRLSASALARRWFPERFIHDTLALAVREAGISENGGGPWDVARYRECG